MGSRGIYGDTAGYPVWGPAQACIAEYAMQACAGLIHTGLVRDIQGYRGPSRQDTCIQLYTGIEGLG